MFKQPVYNKVKKGMRPKTEYISDVLERMNAGCLPIDPSDHFEGDGEPYPRNTTGPTPEAAAKPENRFEARINMQTQVRCNRKYLEVRIGDSVKAWKQKR